MNVFIRATSVVVCCSVYVNGDLLFIVRSPVCRESESTCPPDGVTRRFTMLIS